VGPSVTNVYCGKMVERIKLIFGTLLTLDPLPLSAPTVKKIWLGKNPKFTSGFGRLSLHLLSFLLVECGMTSFQPCHSGYILGQLHT